VIDMLVPPGGGPGPHAFKNMTDKIAHLLCTVVPAGLDSFFQEIGQPLESDKFLSTAAPTAEALDKLKALGEKYGQEFYPPDYLG
jgi:hypothetical protein